MIIRIAGTVNDSIVDGPGLRFTVFTQGCPHHCAGCHNPETHEFVGGTNVDTKDLIESFSGNPLLSGLTLSGGEPFEQAVACSELACEAKKMKLNVWTYTGYKFEVLQALNDAAVNMLLHYTDVLVDGPFILAERSLELKFCGSRNQRLIDITRTNQTGNVALWAPPVW